MYRRGNRDTRESSRDGAKALIKLYLRPLCFLDFQSQKLTYSSSCINQLDEVSDANKRKITDRDANRNFEKKSYVVK